MQVLKNLKWFLVFSAVVLTIFLVYIYFGVQKNGTIDSKVGAFEGVTYEKYTFVGTDEEKVTMVNTLIELNKQYPSTFDMGQCIVTDKDEESCALKMLKIFGESLPATIKDDPIVVPVASDLLGAGEITVIDLINKITATTTVATEAQLEQIANVK